MLLYRPRKYELCYFKWALSTWRIPSKISSRVFSVQLLYFPIFISQTFVGAQTFDSFTFKNAKLLATQSLVSVHLKAWELIVFENFNEN